MEPQSLRAARQLAIEHQVHKLEPRIARLRSLSNIWSWVRAGTSIGGFVGGVVVGNLTNARFGLAVFMAGLFLFVISIFVHRRFEYWYQVFTSWRDWRVDQLARMILDWSKLPPARSNSRDNPLAFDLDLLGPRSLHHLLDTTSARPSSRLLADWLAQPRPDLDALRARQQIIRELIPFSRFRDRFRLAFRLALKEQIEGEDLLHWLQVDFPSGRLPWLLIIAALLVLLNITLYVLYEWAAFPPIWVGTFLAYVIFFFVSQTSLGTIFSTLTRLDAELDRFGAVLKYIENYPIHDSPHLTALCAPLRDRSESPSSQMRVLKIVAAGIGLRSNPVLGLILNVIFPWDFMFAFLAGIARARLADSFPQWLKICYDLDALIALANFAYLNSDNAFPEYAVDCSPVFKAVAIGHPLIPQPQRVQNSFTVDQLGQVDIITGSNMAGKSTFLKTIGINQCLGYSGAPVCATYLHSVPLRLHTCIRITDSIVDGFSYFYAEVKCLRRLLDSVTTSDALPLLYMIDEIFRGTNNRERLIGSRAYVKALIGKRGIGLLATHDLELATLAEQSPLVRNMHFRDQVEDNRLTFDYTLRPGPSPTTNAIRIMQMEGLPVPLDGTTAAESDR